MPRINSLYHRLVVRNADFRSGTYSIDFVKDHLPQDLLKTTEFSLFEGIGR